MGNCCVNCFEDRYLRSLVAGSLQVGDCDYCGSRGIPVCDTATIGKIVRNGLLRVYEPVGGVQHTRNVLDVAPSTDGKALYWVITLEEQFLNGDLPFGTHKMLAGDLLSGGCSESEPLLSMHASVEARKRPGFVFRYDAWEWFKDDVKYCSRFFRGADLRRKDSFLGRMAGIIEALNTTLPKGTNVYRARVADHPFERVASELGPPPPTSARHSRMSPVGISYMYGGDSAELCLAEVRPHVGSEVCIGRFVAMRDLQLLDLCDLPSIFDPSIPDDTLFSREILRGFLEDVRRPVSPGQDMLEYLPTQVFSEFVRAQRYDGIRYPGI